MKVLRINSTDIKGGAAIAIYRLHEGLLNKGIDSKFLVSTASTSSKLVSLLPPAQKLDYSLKRFTYKIGFNDIHLLSTFSISHHKFYQEANILHLHNLHGGYFNYLALPHLTQFKPAILTLHDMWAITGHCAYSDGCTRWQMGCGHCPDLQTYPSVKRDSTRWEWKLKQWAYRSSGIKAVVTTSCWMAEQVQKSILGYLPIHRIPPGLNCTVYKPLDPDQCRRILGIKPGNYVLLTASDRLSDPRKGGDLLIQAINTLPDTLRSNTTLLLLGYGAEKLAESLDINVLTLGFVGNDHCKALIYSASDLFLFPTRAENFGLVAQEAIACGTPVIAFGVGGVPDIVRPGITGLLAEPENPISFRDAIVQLLEDSESRQRMGEAGRAIAEAEYSIELYAQRYIDLYEKVLQSA